MQSHKQLLAQVAKAQAEIAKWPKSWRDSIGFDLWILKCSSKYKR